MLGTMNKTISPRKKKPKLEETETGNTNSVKREGAVVSLTKKMKVEKTEHEVDILALKRKNFVTACEQVSYRAYFDFGYRLQLIYLPPCMNAETCNHLDSEKIANIRPIPDYAEQSIRIELKSYTWGEALEICQLCITPDQYLTADVLKEVVEIILNAQDDSFADFSAEELVETCQQILYQSFSIHPPCVMKTLRNLYKDFLISPMNLKEKTFSDRKKYDCDKGIVKYCMNRLEHEISLDSKDEAIIDKDENMPEEMTQSVKGLHWQKEKFEIYEVLTRPERIKRLMAVLESLIELLQFDLAIWNSRYKNDLNKHVMRSHRPLMAFVLWSNNILYTGAVNNNCRQIFRLFAYLIHLQYPEDHIRIMSSWLNVICETFYICENNANSDYPNTMKYCNAFAREFYKIIADMPQATIIRILEQIHPSFMQYLIGLRHIQSILSTDEDNIIKIMIAFLKEEQWEMFEESTDEIKIIKTDLIRPRQVKNMDKYFAKIFKHIKDLEDEVETVYPKLDTNNMTAGFKTVDRNQVLHALYITVDAFLDAYSIQNVQETIDSLNEKLSENGQMVSSTSVPENCSYSVTEGFIKKYRSFYQNLTELISVLNNIDKTKMPEIKIFENIGLL